MNKKYIVRLTEEERVALNALVSKGVASAQKIKHANVLLKIDAAGPAWADEQAAEVFGCSSRTMSSIRQHCVEQGLEVALERKKRERPACEPMLDGAKQPRLVQIACSEPPPGRARWDCACSARPAMQAGWQLYAVGLRPSRRSLRSLSAGIACVARWADLGLHDLQDHAA